MPRSLPAQDCPPGPPPPNLDPAKCINADDSSANALFDADVFGQPFPDTSNTRSIRDAMEPATRELQRMFACTDTAGGDRALVETENAPVALRPLPGPRRQGATGRIESTDGSAGVGSMSGRLAEGLRAATCEPRTRANRSPFRRSAKCRSTRRCSTRAPKTASPSRTWSTA